MGDRYPYFIKDREPYRTKITPFGEVRFAVLNTKRLTVPILVRYGSRSNTKKRTATIKGSVRFTLQTVRQKNGTVTVALVVKNRYCKKTENGTVRYEHGSGDKFGPPIVNWVLKLKKFLFIFTVNTHLEGRVLIT